MHNLKSFDEKLYIRETYHQNLYQNKKIVILHVKDDFSKIKKSICKIPIEAANISHILPRQYFSTDYLWLNWKEILNTGFMYILNLSVYTLYTRHLLKLLTYKSCIKFCGDIYLYIKKGLSSEGMFTFSDIVEIQGHSECITEKRIFLMKKKLLKI